MSNLPSFTSLISGMVTLERALTDFETGLASTTSQSASSDGLVTVVADGAGRLVSVAIDPSLVSPGDPVGLATEVTTVANAALTAAGAQAATAAVNFAKALSLPGLPAYGAAAPTYTGFSASASLVTSTALANIPCQQPRQFQCQSGPVLATLNADRQIVSLVFDSPLPEFVTTLQDSIVAAVNCAVAKSNNPPDDVHNGAGAIASGTVGFQSLVVYGNDEIELDSGATVKGIGCQGYGQIGNAGTGTVNINSGANVGNILSRGNVIVAGHVHGTITTEGTEQTLLGGVVDSTIAQNHAVVLPILKVGVVFPSTSQHGINLGLNQHASAAPAYYQSILLNSGSVLTLTAGEYFTDNLTLLLGSKIVVDATNGPVILWVKSNFVFQGTLQDAAGVFPRIWIGYIGTLPVTLATPFQGSLVAPNASVTLAAGIGATHTGSFHAKEVEVGLSQTVCHHPFELPFSQIPGAQPPAPPPVPISAATAAILGFESATAWSSTQATVALVTTPITQGTSALRVTGIHPILASVGSQSFSAAGITSPGGQVLIDVYMTNAQLGQMDIQAKIPSAGILVPLGFGIQSISGKPLNQYTTLTFPVPANVATAIANGASDVTLYVVFALPIPSGTFYLDNLRFI
jgi:DNA-binding protein YbaB